MDFVATHYIYKSTLKNWNYFTYTLRINTYLKIFFSLLLRKIKNCFQLYVSIFCILCTTFNIHTDISVAFMQQENGTPQRSTLGLVQLKYSFFPQSRYPSWLKPQHLNCNGKFYIHPYTKLNNLYKHYLCFNNFIWSYSHIIFTSCCPKSMKFCRSGSSLYVWIILSVKDCSKRDCNAVGNIKPTIATPISRRKNTRRHNEYWKNHLIRHIMKYNLYITERLFCKRTNKFKKACVLTKSSYTSCKTNNKDNATCYQHH